MTIAEIIYLMGVGLFAGTASGLFGIGGGVIIVPLLIFFFNLSQKTASATSLIAMILPVGIFAVWEYYKAGVVQSPHFKMGLLISLGIFFGAFFGTKLALILPTKLVTKGFALLLIYVSIRLWLKSDT